MDEFNERSLLKRILSAPFRALWGLLFWISHAGENIERGFQRLTSRTTEVGDTFIQTDSLLKRFFSILFFPLIWVWHRLVRPVGDFFLSSATLKRIGQLNYWLWYPVIAFTSLINKTDSVFKRFFSVLFFPLVWVWFKIVVPVGDLLHSNHLFQRLGHLTFWIWYPLVAVASFGFTFMQTRSRELLIWSLPFVLVIGGTLLVLWTMAPRKNTVALKYREAVEEALAKGEYQQAQLYQQKLQTLGVSSDQTQMRQIDELAKSGKIVEAIELAERLAPLDKPGYADAHFWLARVYFEGQSSSKGMAALERAEIHLIRLRESILAMTNKSISLPPEVMMLEALIAFKKDKTEEGLELIKAISDRYWPALILQMETHLKLGRVENVMQDALSISKAIKKVPAIIDEVSPLFFQMWCDALAAAGEREELKHAISLWYQKHPDDPKAILEWSTVQFLEVETLMVRGSDTDMAKATDSLVQATNRLGAQNHPVISSWFYRQLPPTKNNPNFLKLAELMAKHEEVSSVVLEILGTAATSRDEHQLALSLLKAATEKDPENAIAWNNLAYVANLHFENEIQLALDAAEKAARIQPENIDILHTRGFIYIRLKQWDSAIQDLRAVVARRPNANEVHRALAQAYRAAGKTELASVHESMAQ